MSKKKDSVVQNTGVLNSQVRTSLFNKAKRETFHGEEKAVKNIKIYKLRK